MYSEKELLIYAINGAGFPSEAYADKMAKRGYAKFCGNQWAPGWRWDNDALARLDVDCLRKMFAELESNKSR